MTDRGEIKLTFHVRIIQMLVSGTFFELLQPFEFFTFSQNGEKKTFRRKKGRKKGRKERRKERGKSSKKWLLLIFVVLQQIKLSEKNRLFCPGKCDCKQQ
jgi:hypothetical protein